MRDDYFTLEELTRLLHTSEYKVKRAMNGQYALPHCKCGTIYVIPKARFFAWYERLQRSGLLCEALGPIVPLYHDIYIARDKWLKDRYGIEKGAASIGEQKRTPRSEQSQTGIHAQVR